MKRTVPFAALLFSLALGQVAHAATGAGTTINNTASATYPDPDGGTDITVLSNKVETKVSAVPSLIINQEAQDNGTQAAPFSPKSSGGTTFTSAPVGSTVVVPYTLKNTGNTDDFYALSLDPDSVNPGVVVTFYAANPDTSGNGLLDGTEVLGTPITQLGSLSDPLAPNETRKFYVVYTVVGTAPIKVGPTGTSQLSTSGSGTNRNVDTNGDGVVNGSDTNPAPVTYPTASGAVYDGKSGTVVQGSQNIHQITPVSLNTPPTADPHTSQTISNPSGTGYTVLTPFLSGDDVDPDANPGGVVQDFILKTLPNPSTQGTLRYDPTPGSPNSGDEVVLTTANIGTTPILPGGSLSFDPVDGFTGNATFTYVSRDTLNLESTTAAIYTIPVSITGTVSGVVYSDDNDNGAQDVSEAGIGGVTVTLQDSSGTPVTFDVDPSTPGIQSSVVTGADGSYTFANVPAGTFRVVETQPPTLADGKDTAGSNAVIPASTNDRIDVTLSALSPSSSGNLFGERPAVSAVKSVSPTTTVSAGDVLTYTITLTNNSATAIPDATFQDSIPVRSYYVLNSTTLDGAPVADLGGATSVNSFPYSSAASVGTLAANGSKTISFQVKAAGISTPGLNIQNQGTVTYAGAPTGGVLTDSDPVTTGAQPTLNPLTPQPTICATSSRGTNLFQVAPYGPSFGTNTTLPLVEGTVAPALSGEGSATDPTPGYNYVGSYAPSDGNYTIINRPGTVGFGVWHRPFDHTTGDLAGNMMVINANAGTAPNIFYRETLTVAPNTNYEFSAWVLNILASNIATNSSYVDPNLGFYIDREGVDDDGDGLIDAADTNGDLQRVDASGDLNEQITPTWLNFGAVVNSGATTKITVSFVNEVLGGNGNDLALDDLFFGTCSVAGGNITGTLFKDVNSNGVIDAPQDTPKGSNISVQLINTAGEVVATTDTLNGVYTFTNVPLGNYTIKVITTDPDLTGGNVPTLPVGAERSVTLTAAGLTGQNFGFISPTTSADLELKKSVVARNAVKGDTVTFTLVVTNKGPDAVSGSSVSDTLPAGFSTPTITSSTGGSFSSATPPVLTWNVPNLAALATSTLTFTAVVVDPAALAAGDYKNTATVTLPVGVTDPTPGNNISSAELGALVLEKKVRNFTLNPTGPFATTGTGKPTEVLEYCIDAKNLNSRALIGVKVSDVIPTNTTFSSFSTGSTGTPVGTPVTSVDFTPIPSLASDTTVRQCFKVTIN